MTPIYRAKKIDSDEYIEGFLIRKFTEWSSINISSEQLYYSDEEIDKFNCYCIQTENKLGHLKECEIDVSTLSIHFSDMLDSEGTRIFASLSEDGKGGDICVHPYDIPEDNIYPLIYKDGGIRRYFPFGKSFVVKSKFNDYKVVGIQK